MSNGNGQSHPPPPAAAQEPVITPTDLRGLLQYVPRFQGQIFIVAMDGSIIADENFSNLLVDLAILRGLRLKLVLIQGTGDDIH